MNKKAFITHATEKYLSVAHNLATSIRAFSDIPVIVYCIDVQKKVTKKRTVVRFV